MPLFETTGLCKYFRAGARDEVRALDDVTLSIEQGNFIALTGPSGSGKTTLLTILGALDRPTRGKVVFNGADLSDCSDAALARVRRRLGFVFQSFSLITSLSAADNIIYPLIPRGVAPAERQRRARNLLARFGMSDRFAAQASRLSGGEQQRVAIARALAGLPEVVLADEPTSNLDPDTGRIMLDVFRELHAGGATLLVASHDERLISMATHQIELERGRVKRQRQIASDGNSGLS